MLQPIYFSQNNLSNNYRKNIQFNSTGNAIREHLSQQKVVREGSSVEDVRLGYNSIILVLLTLIAGLVAVNLRGKNLSLFEKNANKFNSLKNDANVPTLDNCKSINKNLKTMLQRQLKLTNADASLFEEVGKPNTSNRILLSGPPGNGKTYFSKVYAKTLDAEYMEVLFSELNSKWVGEVEGNMTSMFKKVIKQAKKNPNKKYVLTFNEIDSIVSPVEHLFGGNGSTHFASLRRQRTIFLTYLDKLQIEAPNVTVIGTTNLSTQSKNLDNASISRFQNVIEVPFPDKDALYEAIKMGIKKIKIKDNFISDNEVQIKALAEEMANRKYSFRNLENILDDAKIMYLEEKMNNRSTSFKLKYLEDAQKNLKKSDGERIIINNPIKKNNNK